MNKFGIPLKTYEQIKNLLNSFTEIEEIRIFGSRAKENYKPSSDIDLVIYGKKIDEKLLLHIASELDELPTPYKFDIVDYKTISNLNFKNEIDKYSAKF